MDIGQAQSAAELLLDGGPSYFAVVNTDLDCHWQSAALRGLRTDRPRSILGFVSIHSIEHVRSGLEELVRSGRSICDLPLSLNADDGSITATLSAWRLGAIGDFAVLLTPAFGGVSDAPKSLADVAQTRDHILNAAGDGIYGLAVDGTATFVNQAAVDLLGWKLEDIVGTTVHEVHHHSHADGTPYPIEDCPIYAAIKDGQVHREDNEVFWAADGRAVPVEYASTPIIVDDEIKGAVVVFRSIEERLLAERRRKIAFEEIAHLKQAHETLLNAAGEGIYGLDRNGQATFINQAAEKMLGWSQADVVGQSIHEVHHHSHADGTPYPRDQCPIYAAITDGEVHRVDHEVFWRRDGSPIPVEYTSTPVLTNGEPDGAVVVFRDISHRRALEAERDRAYEQIKALNRELEQERAYLREEVDQASNFGEIIGESDSLTHTLSQIDAVAATPVNVLVHGESGVGKEMIARAIHARSDRAEATLVRVNCASIPEHLFESEFFGHVKGAFTGAHRNRVGRMELADGGTLFLDEVGEIPLSLQGKLLRALQEGQFERVGDEKTITVNVRIVAATNRDLKAEIEAGRFRQDLYYRLSVFPIEVAPLRDRRADIAPLALHFIEQFCKQLGRTPLALRQKDVAFLEAQSWEGNVRELKNFVERAVILSRGPRIQIEHDVATLKPNEGLSSLGDYLTAAEFRELEKRNIRCALEAANWRVSGENGAAALLGVKPSTLAYQVKSLGLKRE